MLCGSRKYPIKEPFVELMKGSLNTFLNAFTYPDRTCYPVASTNAQVRRVNGHFEWLWVYENDLHYRGLPPLISAQRMLHHNLYSVAMR